MADDSTNTSEVKAEGASSTTASSTAASSTAASSTAASSTAANESKAEGKAQDAGHKVEGEGSVEDHYGEPQGGQDRLYLHHTTIVERTMEDGEKVTVATDSPREGDIPQKVANKRRLDSEAETLESKSSK